jgi:hypothetical protein
MRQLVPVHPGQQKRRALRVESLEAIVAGGLSLEL